LLVPSHWSAEQGLPSSVQAVPADFLESVGHAWPGVPPQVSPMSHSPAAARQTVKAGRVTSGGQVVVTPVQTSSGSQRSPEPGRQTAPVFPAGCWQSLFVPSHWSRLHGLPSDVQPVPLGSLASAGHVEAVPVQLSATSHSPPAERQTKVEACNASLGHAALVPVQVSAMSHAPAEARHVVVDETKESLGHAALLPVQFSAASQMSAEERQTIVDEAKLSAGHAALAPVQFSPCHRRRPRRGTSCCST